MEHDMLHAHTPAQQEHNSIYVPELNCSRMSAVIQAQLIATLYVPPSLQHVVYIRLASNCFALSARLFSSC
jgi:hypothetical protein